MKEKHIYIGISILFLLILKIVDYNVICDYQYLHKVFYVPIFTFFLIGVSKKVRNANPMILMPCIVLADMLIDFSFILLGKNWLYIISIILAGVLTHLLRMLIHGLCKRNI
jgi:cytochrome b561